MTKWLKYIMVSLTILCLSDNAQAMAKFDVSNTINKIVTQVSTTAQQAQEYTGGVLEDAKSNLLTNPMDEFNKMQEEANGAIGAATAAKNAAEEAAGTAAGVVNEASEAANAASGAVSSVANSDAVALANLQKEQAAAKRNCDMEVQDLETAQNEEVKKYEDNIETLRELMTTEKENESNYNEQIQSAQTEIEAIKEKYQQQIEEKKAACESENSAYADQIKELTEKAAGVDMDSLQGAAQDKLAGAASGLFGGGDEGSAVQDAIIAQNFYAAGETDNANRNSEIVAYRQKVALEDSADVYFRAVEIMRQGDKYVDAIKELKSKADGAEKLPNGTMQITQMKIEQMKMLLNYAYLMIAEMKVATAQDMLTMPKHLDNYEKNAAEFNMDDYDPKKHENKKSKWLKKAKDLGEQLKGAL